MTLDLQRIQALCFDVDGTLSDTDDIYVEKVSRFLRPIRFLLPGQNPIRAARRLVMWSETPGNVLLGMPDILGLDDELLAFIEWLNRNRARPMKHFMMVPEVDRMLGKLHGYFPMAVVSARDEQGTRQFLDLYNLTRFFDPVVTAITTEHTKPYPDPILYAAQKMGVNPENCLMIGDTTVDIRAGRAAGAQTVGVLCGFGEEPELRRCGADLILENTPELAGLLLEGQERKPVR
ncbi:MAG: HAD family hydrolase [Anaerolineales bacterium]|nr:HAD family hydrolase [Anaerolineales bacterium]